MLCVKTIVKSSKISGLGLYALEKIPKGTIVWKYNDQLDRIYSIEDLENLSVVSKEQILNYSYFDERLNGYVLCGDDARFFNHSEDSNCDDSNVDTTVASRDIEAGEELTVNYLDFYDNKHLEKLNWIKN